MKPGASNCSLCEENRKGHPSMHHLAARPTRGPIRFSERDSVWRAGDGRRSWVVSAATTAPETQATAYPSTQDYVLMGGSR